MAFGSKFQKMISNLHWQEIDHHGPPPHHLRKELGNKDVIVTHIQTATIQQEFLRAAARELGLTQSQLAARMCAPWATFQKWLAPAGSLQGREMPQIAWQLVREILAHEELKNNWEQRLWL